MLTKEENERLTRVGPGTPCGELLRRYWQPGLLRGRAHRERPKQAREDHGRGAGRLPRRAAATTAASAEHCAHRGVSLYYGFVEDCGIRCAYHGWKYDADRAVPGAAVRADGQHLQGARAAARLSGAEAGGLLFVYMGPAPAPLLPRWDVLVREDGEPQVDSRRC